MKGTDKKTSLLAFVTRALITRGNSSVGTLPCQLAAVPPAAVLQVSVYPLCFEIPPCCPCAVLQVSPTPPSLSGRHAPPQHLLGLSTILKHPLMMKKSAVMMSKRTCYG